MAIAEVKEEQKVYVCLPSNYEKGERILSWALNHFPKDATKIIATSIIPTSDPNHPQYNSIRKWREKCNINLDIHLAQCATQKFRADKLICEYGDEFIEGILELIDLRAIKNLVTWLSPNSQISIIMAEKANPSCKIWFLYEGNLIFTRNPKSDLNEATSEEKLTQNELDKQKQQLRERISDLEIEYNKLKQERDNAIKEAQELNPCKSKDKGKGKAHPEISGNDNSGVIKPLKIKPGAEKLLKRKEVPSSPKEVLCPEKKGKYVLVAREEKKRRMEVTKAVAPEPTIEEEVGDSVLSVPAEVEDNPATATRNQIIVRASEAGGSSTSQFLSSEPDDQELANYLKITIPDSEKLTGLVWKDNSPPRYLDYVSVHLPGYSAMKSGDDSDPDLRARYSQEVFRATATTSQKKMLNENPQAALDTIMSSIHDLGVAFDHFKDAYDKQELGLQFINPDDAVAKKAVEERDYFKTLIKGQQHQRGLLEKEVSLLKKDVDIKNLNLKAHRAKIDEYEKRLDAQAGELRELKAQAGELAEAKAKITHLKEEKEKAGPEYLSRFLGSEAFAQAVPYANLNVMRHTIYRELKEVSQAFPFTPEHTGFAKIPDEEATITRLSGYSWDDKEDHLLKPDGSVFNEPLKLESHSPEMFPYQWREYLEWPSDVEVLGSDEEEDKVKLAKMLLILLLAKTIEDSFKPGNVVALGLCRISL